MLSRVAERLFWSARYLERVENIARLVSVYDELLYDLPRDVRVSWYNLIEINGNPAEYSENYSDHGEKSVMRFLLSDKENPSSLLSSLFMVRENIRTTRDVVPEEMWELINEVCLHAKKNIQSGINRSDRHAYLNTVIEGCQKINGLLGSVMSRNEAWSFISMGRYVERADMNTRILDSAVKLKVQSPPEEHVLLDQVIWAKVLKSQSAYLNYLRTMRIGIDGMNTALFLLTDEDFPRSQAFCLKQIKHAAAYLPRHKRVVSEVTKLEDNTYGIEQEGDISQALSDYLNDIQLALIALQNDIRETWFHFSEGEAS
ncbi:alpha-E domain-containing protein [Enterovibrio calviensis]|uniref:alpha-E domain-containing protein n=1 Tax=Enterovibrio calviensis TaxID=91359 RepID=UPI000480548A|nr:alpha-E domain-containing protein [Enterovibrio calviensis]